MQKTILVIIAFLFYKTGLGQVSDSLKKEISSGFDGFIFSREPFMSKYTENFEAYFKPELIDSFFQYIIQDDYDKVYENTDDDVKKIQSKSDFHKYLTLVKLKYGRINSYESKQYSIKTDLMTHKWVASGTYLVEFERLKAFVGTSFVVIDSNNIKLRAFRIKPMDYTQIAEFDSLTKPIFEYLRVKDTLGLYHSTSKRFKKYTLIGDFESGMSELFKVDYTNHRLYQHEIGVIKGQTMYYLTYEIGDASNKIEYLVFTFAETDDKFFLEGLRFKVAGE